MEPPVVEINNVSMCFKLYKEKIDSIKEYSIKALRGKLKYEDFWALKDVSFMLNKGDSIVLIGRNGSGKSTMLKLIAGVMKPTSGVVTVRGGVAPLIELGAGFDPDLTARENIYLNGAVLGYSKQQMRSKFDEIVEFSELEEFIDTPIKNFSSGMYARLGFSIATANNADILIIDEILSVGDFKFKEKCMTRIKQMMSHDTTVLFVSHEVEQVQDLCDKAVWLENGNVRMSGMAKDVCEAYKNS